MYLIQIVLDILLTNNDDKVFLPHLNVQEECMGYIDFAHRYIVRSSKEKLCDVFKVSTVLSQILWIGLIQ